MARNGVVQFYNASNDHMSRSNEYMSIVRRRWQVAGACAAGSRQAGVGAAVQCVPVKVAARRGSCMPNQLNHP